MRIGWIIISRSLVERRRRIRKESSVAEKSALKPSPDDFGSDTAEVGIGGDIES